LPEHRNLVFPRGLQVAVNALVSVIDATAGEAVQFPADAVPGPARADSLIVIKVRADGHLADGRFGDRGVIHGVLRCWRSSVVKSNAGVKAGQRRGAMERLSPRPSP